MQSRCLFGRVLRRVNLAYTCAPIYAYVNQGVCVHEQGAGWQFCGKHCFHAERIFSERYFWDGRSWGEGREGRVGETSINALKIS